MIFPEVKKKSSIFKLSVVVPTINSASFIQDNIKKLDNFLRMCTKIDDYEIIVAAQTSKDNTFSEISKLNPDKIDYLFLKQIGKGVGLTNGFMKAKYEWILMIDDDLPYSFESMEELFNWRKDFDVIIASRQIYRFDSHIPFMRRVASEVYLKIIQFLFKLPQKDIQAGMKLIKNDIFDKVPYPKEKGYVWDTELLSFVNKWGYKVIEVPVKCNNHKPNQLVIYKAVPSMILGLSRVWWRYNFKKEKTGR